MEYHPGVSHILQFFKADHLPPHLAEICMECNQLANSVAGKGDGPELTAGLRKLLEAKDCFVRSALRPRDHHHTNSPE